MADARTALITTVIALMALAAPALAHSGGSGGGASSGGGGSSGAGNGAAAAGNSGALRDNTPSCAPGYVFKNGGCLHVSRGVLPDDQLYAQGRALAVAGYYQHALPILEAVTRSDDSMVYTMRGYALRKLGHFDEGMALYAKALAIDPRNVNTHEYMGEAYVIAGRVDDARIELAKVASICGSTTCEQYTDLAEAIETGKPE